jgi:hypothetical protein
MTRPRRWRWLGRLATLVIAVPIGFAWLLCVLSVLTGDTDATVMFALLFLPVVASAALLWRLDVNPKPGRCFHCGYDLSGTPPSAPCPECGHVATHQNKGDAAATHQG